jgi:hypothetical protein
MVDSMAFHARNLTTSKQSDICCSSDQIHIILSGLRSIEASEVKWSVGIYLATIEDSNA